MMEDICHFKNLHERWTDNQIQLANQEINEHYNEIDRLLNQGADPNAIFGNDGGYTALGLFTMILSELQGRIKWARGRGGDNDKDCQPSI